MHALIRVIHDVCRIGLIAHRDLHGVRVRQDLLGEVWQFRAESLICCCATFYCLALFLNAFYLFPLNVLFKASVFFTGRENLNAYLDLQGCEVQFASACRCCWCQKLMCSLGNCFRKWIFMLESFVARISLAHLCGLLSSEDFWLQDI